MSSRRGKRGEKTVNDKKEDLKSKCRIGLWYLSIREVKGKTDLEAEKFVR